MRRVQLAVLGGTFDHLHAGHHALLGTAFRVGREVAIGLTSDQYVRDHPKPGTPALQSYRQRRARLRRWLSVSYPGRRWRITPLGDGVGRSVEVGVGALVVSPETKAGGRVVNRARRHLGRPPVPLIEVPLVLADDLKPVSSRRIRAGEITSEGRRLSPIRVELRVEDARDDAPAERAIRRVFPRAQVARYEGPAARERTVSRARGRPSTTTSRARVELRISIGRARPVGWVVAESSPEIRLPPRRVRGHRAQDLERGLVSVLRPRL